MKKNKKVSKLIGKASYFIALPIIALGVVSMLSSVQKDRPDNIKDNSKIEAEIIENNDKKNILNFGNSSQKPSLEEIVAQELNSTLKESDNAETDSATNNVPPADPLATDLDSNVVVDYSNLTLSDIVEKGTEDIKDNSFLAKDLAIRYTESSYKGITKDGAFVLNINGEDKYIYLTGVNVTDAQPIADLMYGVQNVYIEYDINTKRGAGEQGYLWLIPPDNDKKESMINCIVLENGWGSYTDPMPNIKYQYYFLKIKP